MISESFSNAAPKYEILNDGGLEINTEWGPLKRIRALRNFANVRKGDLGGGVAGHHNLSHDGNCWIYDNSTVSGCAKISGNARVELGASIFDNTTVTDESVLGGIAVGGNVVISGRTKIDIRTCKSSCDTLILSDSIHNGWRRPSGTPIPFLDDPTRYVKRVLGCLVRRGARCG